VLPCWTQRKG